MAKMVKTHLDSPKYNILSIIRKNFKNGKLKEIKIALSMALRMSWNFFLMVANAQDGDETYFEERQLKVIAEILKVDQIKLHAHPKYRIAEIIDADSRKSPIQWKKEIRRKLRDHFDSDETIRVKLNAMSGQRNGLTTGQLQLIADVFGLPVSELYCQTESVPA